MSDEFQVSDVIPATPEQVYDAWLDSREHSGMTGGAAMVDPAAGGRFTAWDGYITGTTLERKAYSRIVQTWRSTEFPDDSPDSRLYVTLKPAEAGTRVTLLHTDIPDGQGDRYRRGWAEAYFEPMKRYFGGEGRGVKKGWRIKD